MVRLVVLSVVMSALAACTHLQVPPAPESVKSEEPEEVIRLSALDQGEHHPAVKHLLGQAEQARKNEDWSRAVSYLDQARQIQPRNPNIIFRQGWLEFQRGNLNRAAQLLQRAEVFLKGDRRLKAQIDELLEDIRSRQVK